MMMNSRSRIQDEVQQAGLLLAQEEQEEALHGTFAHQEAAHVCAVIERTPTKVQCALDADP